MTDSYLRPGPGTPLPSPETIRSWWDEYGMLDNIREHSEVVCRVALVLYDWLSEGGLKLFRQAVEAGALVHDIAKTQCLGSEKRHSIEGGLILEQKGYPELAYMVRNHVYLPPEHPLDETMVVTYADKRVNHARVVSLAERFDYILGNYGKKYPEHIPRMLAGRDQIFLVEKKIFQHMANGRSPQDLVALFQKEA